MTIFESDRRLLAQFKNGDKAALEKVYYFYIDTVDTMIRNGFYEKNSAAYIPGIHDIDTQNDLVHEVFSKAFKKSALEAYDGIRPYGSYLKTIVRNTVLDYYRKRKRDPLTQLNEATSGAQSPAQSPDVDALQDATEAKSDTADALHLERCIAACATYLAALGERDKEIVEQRYRRGLKQQDVAEKLGISRWKVRSAERKIEAGLRRFLKKEGLL